jgi:hypoxanthine phosphoribosyltransferase
METLFDNCRMLISSDEIQDRVRELAQRISVDYSDRNPLFITLLKGGFIFLADLVRNLSIPCEIEFVTASSYRDGMHRSADVEINAHLKSDLEGREVIVVEGIVDTGHTLINLMHTLSEQRVKNYRVCTLLDKPSAREVEAPVHYVGFEIPDVFAVGYGLDFMERYRNLSYIAELSPTAAGVSAPARNVKRPDFSVSSVAPVILDQSRRDRREDEREHR